ncbi:MAG: NF038122 family metalloprotease [Verrucomicrobia bacterium]|nr:NF038122 family metalloprotease [Verrucomicrobiota bacterium]
MRKQFRGLFFAVALLCSPFPAGAIYFNFEPDPGTSQAAIDGFVQAGDLWNTYLGDNITVNIQIGFTALDPGVIAQAWSNATGPSYSSVLSALQSHARSLDDFSAYASLPSGSSYSRLINYTSNNPNGPNSNVPYIDSMDWVGLTTANAKVLGLLGPNAIADARIVFSSSFSFDFNHASVGPFSIDFVGAAAHEIGHALGFMSGVDDIDTMGGSQPGNDFSSNMIDLFRYSTNSIATGSGVTDYTAGDAYPKYFSVDGGTDAIAQFAAGKVLGDGQQASHWKDGLNLGIMGPTAGYGQTLNISTNDVRAMDVIGYTLVPEPRTAQLVLVAFAVWVGGLGSRRRGT